MQLIFKLANRKTKTFLFVVLLYILDAWLLGSPAVILHDYKNGLVCFKNPLLAAVKVPFAGVFSVWLIFNIIALMLIGAVIFFVYVRFPEVVDRLRPRKLTFTDDPTGGTSKWMPPEDIPKTFELGHGPGILLGAYEGTPIRLYNKSNLNRNVMAFGGPGSGKTYSEIIPNCLQAVVNQESVIIIDPKSEIARATLAFFQNRGYNVKVFNLVDMLHSDRWNPLDEVVSDLDAQVFTQTVIANTAVPGIKKMGGDPFWDRSEQNLLKALTMYVKTERPKEKQTVPEIYSVLAGGDLNELDIIFKSLPENHPAKAPYLIFSQADKAKGSIIQGLGTRLQVFQYEQVRKLTEASDIDLEAPGREKCAYYCVISDTDNAFEFLSSLFFTFLFIKLTKLGDRSGGRCPVGINFLLDEFCNIGTIPEFKRRIATMRSRGIFCTIITQSLPQLRNRYPNDEWQEIISCCDTRLFLGVNDNDTAKYLSESLDEGTVEQQSIRRNTKDLLNVQVTRSPRSRSLMTPGEALRMEEREAVLIVRGRYPLKIEKLGYPEHPFAGELIPREITEYEPAWHKKPLPEITIEWGEEKAGELPDSLPDAVQEDIEIDIHNVIQETGPPPKDGNSKNTWF
ncbi:MAG: type IV secretory system conjugative DNA transfer family protein [Firmicutes bacterium]|nr:type IV secretory system conjugative DNA transfer family protein [Bacillota bacterium]